MDRSITCIYLLHPYPSALAKALGSPWGPMGTLLIHSRPAASKGLDLAHTDKPSWLLEGLAETLIPLGGRGRLFTNPNPYWLQDACPDLINIYLLLLPIVRFSAHLSRPLLHDTRSSPFPMSYDRIARPPCSVHEKCCPSSWYVTQHEPRLDAAHEHERMAETP